MSQSDELEELARRYVDLWQDQMTALAADPDFAEAMQRVMATLGVSAAGLPAAWAAWPAAMGSMMAAAHPGPSSEQGPAGGQDKDAGTAGSGSATKGGTGNGTAGAPPAAAASDGGGDDLGVITQRLAALEQRVLALEGGSWPNAPSKLSSQSLNG